MIFAFSRQVKEKCNIIFALAKIALTVKVNIIGIANIIKNLHSLLAYFFYHSRKEAVYFTKRLCRFHFIIHKVNVFLLVASAAVVKYSLSADAMQTSV